MTKPFLLLGRCRPIHPSMSVVVLAHAYAKQGKRAETEQQISSLRDLAKTRYIRPYFFASIYAALGDKDNAFAELEKSFAERDCLSRPDYSRPVHGPVARRSAIQKPDEENEPVGSG